MNVGEAVVLAVDELRRATEKNGSFVSAHEGYSVILEELDELWDEIKKKSSERDPERLKEEAKHVAAMALRFLVDLC